MGFELLLPVVLFLLTLIIIFLLRSDDKRNQRTELIRKRSQALLKNVENSQTQFKEYSQKVEERISKKIDESHLLMSHVDSQLTDLEARSEDLATLQKVLTTYQTSLTQLESTTTQVEQRVVMMKNEIANILRVQESLDSFDLRFEQFKQNVVQQITDGEESLHIQQIKFKELQNTSFAKLQEYEKEVQQVEQDNLAQIAAHTEVLKDRQEASLNIVSSQATKLRLLGEEGDQQMLLYEKALQAAHRQAHEKLQEQLRESIQLQAKHAEQQKRQEEELLAIEKKAVLHITEEMESFVQQCYGEVSKIFEMTLRKTDVSFQNMIRVVSEYLKELSLRLEHAQAVTKLLGTSEHTSLHSFKEDLNTLLEETSKGEQNLKTMQGLEEKASSALTLLHQESQQLRQSLESMKDEKLALLKESGPEGPPQSVVFAMALVEEACTPHEKIQEILREEPAIADEMAEPSVEQENPEPSIVEISLPSLPFAMALSEEAEDEKGEADQEVAPDKNKPDVVEKRQVEYLTESEEELIDLDDDDASY